MQVIPAVDIRGGKCVQLVGGKPGTGKEHGDPVRSSLEWQRRGASWLHVVDLDAAMGEGDGNLEKIEEILEKLSIKVQVGGGIRSVDKALKILGLGAERIIMGTAAFKSPDTVREVVERVGSDKLIVALDVRGGKIAVEGWRETSETDPVEMAKNFEDMGVGGFLFTNIDVEGKMTGLDTKVIKRLTGSVSVPVMVAGGVKSISDVRKAREAGASGLVIGTALYEGKISLEKAMEVVTSEEG